MHNTEVVKLLLGNDYEITEEGKIGKHSLVRQIQLDLFCPICPKVCLCILFGSAAVFKFIVA